MEDYSAPPPYVKNPSASHQCSTEAWRAPQLQLRHQLDPPTAASASIPRRYPVNGQQIRMLSTQELSDHLVLLHALRALRKRVETSDEVDQVSVGSMLWGELSSEERWRVYVSMAVEAFERYVAGGMKEEPSAEIMLCWYAHLLHPERDVALHGLLPDDVRPIPPSKIKKFIKDMSSLSERPYSTCSTKAKATAVTVDPLDLVRRSSSVLVDSPHTSKPVAIPWIDGRHGFAETHFAWTSTEGEYKKTAHETLGIYRFCRDLVRWRGDKTSFPQGIAKIPEAHDWLFGRNLFTKYPLKSLDAKAMGDLFGWTRQGFLGFVEKQFVKEPVVGKGPWSGRAKIRELSRMVDSYQRGEELAFNLHALLESSWLEEPLLLGWDEQTLPEILEVAVARYHAACDLIAAGFDGGSRPLSMMHPTLDIELARRAHQLSTRAGLAYHSHLGASRAGKANAENSFARNVQAWENRFSAPYALTVSPPSDSKARLSPRDGLEYELDLLVYIHGMLPNSTSPGQATFALCWRFVGPRGSGDHQAGRSSSRLDTSAMTSGAGSQAWLAMATGGR